MPEATEQEMNKQLESQPQAESQPTAIRRRNPVPKGKARVVVDLDKKLFDLIANQAAGNFRKPEQEIMKCLFENFMASTEHAAQS